MFLCFAHINVAILLKNALYLSVNVFSTRVCSRLQPFAGQGTTFIPSCFKIPSIVLAPEIIPPTELVLLNMKLKRVGLFCFFFWQNIGKGRNPLQNISQKEESISQYKLS